MNRLVISHRALRSAAPHRLPDALRRVLRAHYAAESADFLLADYGHGVLLPVTDAARERRPQPVHGTPAGRAFSAQRTVLEEPDGEGAVRAHLPVTARGDRLGVLSVTGVRARRELGELAELAQVLGHEVVVAGRGTDLFHQALRQERLTLTAELQWQLPPARSCERPEFALGAHMHPAYGLQGTCFDWALGADRLTLYLVDGTGEGVDASLRTHLAVAALRNARRAGLPLADQAALTDQALYAHFQGKAHVPALLAELATTTERLRVVAAGASRMVRLRDRAATTVDVEDQLPLGMFEETDYAAQEFALRPGDRLVLVGEGRRSGASGPGGDGPGERALARAVAATGLLRPTEVPAAVLREVAGRQDTGEPDAEAVAACLDWFGARPDGHDGTAAPTG
ncbi:PP2C family protein-serine/threonine phosphatase [Streptomyces sp. TRM68416]|uniref:PP2C family protein-serine/threonine phosphatase n=1 Tax=Streptomyces sp. TRM68416 TaxID=2758412 RepID=UPI001661F792|nr:PP2C family protein-serine/threonine phosphatase [Streptomyces sp. TRM68416]MBD0844712.1 serine/threonine-protein phosphatase [Streptomyces sp. TRM68416]